MGMNDDTISGDADRHAVCVNCHEVITTEEGDELWFRPNVDWLHDWNVLCAGVPKEHPDYRPYPTRNETYYGKHVPADKFVMWCIQLTEESDEQVLAG